MTDQNMPVSDSVVPRAAGEPIAFAGCAGFLHYAVGDVGVVMLSPWGFEEFTVRQGWRGLAQMLAAAGYPALRFDWPGTGDSLGGHGDIVVFEQWRGAARAAIMELRRLLPVKRVLLLGQGLGALIGADLAQEADGFIALAPMAEGRAGVRELDVWGRMVASALRIPVELGAEDALNIGGFRMSKPLYEDLKSFKASSAALTLPALVLARAERDSDSRFAESLQARGAAVRAEAFEAYAAYVAHLETPRMPEADFAKIIAWLKTQFPAGKLGVVGARANHILQRELFSEEAFSFGPERRLYGVLTLPQGAPRGVIVFPNSGYNPHIGWARGHVELARRLAGIGIATLRMDCTSLGDSDADPALVGDVLYSDRQFADVRVALDELQRRGLNRFTLAGRCSGAYIAQNVAEQDMRVAGLVSINALRLIWNPRETLEQAMSGGSGSLGSYGARALSKETLIRLLKGDLPVWNLGKRVAAKVGEKLSGTLAPHVGKLTLMGRLTAKVRGRYEDFAARKVAVALVYAEGDGGLDELAKYCGAGGAWLSRFNNVSLRFVADADHNMTANHAQNAIFEAAEKVIQQIENWNQGSAAAA